MEGFKEEEGKRRASVFSLIFVHPCFCVICACIEFFGVVCYVTESIVCVSGYDFNLFFLVLFLVDYLN